MATDITISAHLYHCEECTHARGQLVTDLVRHMKEPAVLNGKLVADEFWTCPFCLEAKFPASRGAKMPEKPKQVAKPQRRATRPPRTKPRLVVSNV